MSIPLLLLLGVTATAAESLTPQAWLQRMAEGLSQGNYAGTMVYMRGDELESFELVHVFRDGTERERVTFLSGMRREMIRDGEDMTLFTEDGDGLGMDMPLGPFSRVFSDNFSVYRRWYDVTVGGHDRVAGRKTVLLEIRPHDEQRYGYRLWLDMEHAVLLKSSLFRVADGAVVEATQFTNIEFLEEDASADLRPRFIGSVTGAVEADGYGQGSGKGRKRQDWQVAWLPSGFSQSAVSGGDGLMFSDGLASLSIFVDTADEDAEKMAMVTQVGATTVLTRHLADSGRQLTLVGDIPMATAKAIAGSVRLH